MIYRIKITAAFKKSYKLAKKRGLNTDLLDGIIDKLRRGIALECLKNSADYAECRYIFFEFSAIKC